MNEAWIIDTVRTPRGIGKVGKGALADLHPQHLLSTVFKSLASRNLVDTAEIDDIIVGCCTQVGKQSSDIARMAALDAGFHYKAPGITIDRFCGSSISAVNLAAASIMSGMEDLIVAGGVEMMSMTVPIVASMPTDAWNERLRRLYPMTNVGIAADIIATEEGFDRHTLDAYAAESQRRAAVAISEKRFKKSTVPVYRPDGTVALIEEEFPRPTTTIGSLSTLSPVFGNLMNMDFFDTGETYEQLVKRRWPSLQIQHMHHAGNSSGVVDGASGLLIASPDCAKANGWKPRARIVAMANAGHQPEYILNAPVSAAKKVLHKAKMTVDDIDLFEVNEAFAVVPLKFMKNLNISHNKMNVNGGAIALGHPIGATGGILIGTVLDELERQNLSTGLITMCAAGGMAPAIIIERI
ncbi:acetyl-CoA acetyltransferase (plasmid) [Alteromonas sp. I4]|nr:acetyl-CoA acetyltransferase [Alteromonas sp. I4]